jgi:monoterpene epsilon-lactone hydrolase
MIERTSASYLDGKDARSPEVSPLYAPLDGLPPLLVQVGTEELLYSDSERLVERARAAGVEVTFEVGEGLLHVFQSVADAPEARAATDRIGAFLQRAWSTKR